MLPLRSPYRPFARLCVTAAACTALSSGLPPHLALGRGHQSLVCPQAYPGPPDRWVATAVSAPRGSGTARPLAAADPVSSVSLRATGWRLGRKRPACLRRSGSMRGSGRCRSGPSARRGVGLFAGQRLDVVGPAGFGAGRAADLQRRLVWPRAGVGAV